ncbi:MAG: diguanylate cyclase [Gammaproteobacteria bacterium]|nr:diguanylate cyclase [Gammaproteobacteria bacterium]
MLLNQMLRSTDLVSPRGDSELAVSMPYTSVTQGRQIAGSVLSALREQEGNATFSIGLAFTSPNEQQPFELFRRAAWALEISRESGGNRVVVWSDACGVAAADD